MPLLVKFVLNWTAIGVLGGWAVTVAFLVLDVGGIGSLLWRSSSAPLASLVLALSVASTAGPKNRRTLLRQPFAADRMLVKTGRSKMAKTHPHGRLQ